MTTTAIEACDTPEAFGSGACVSKTDQMSHRGRHAGSNARDLASAPSVDPVDKKIAVATG